MRLVWSVRAVRCGAAGAVGAVGADGAGGAVSRFWAGGWRSPLVREGDEGDPQLRRMLAFEEIFDR